MIQPTIQLLVYADERGAERLVRAPLDIRGHYVEVEDYNTGEKLRVHVADLRETGK